MKSNFLENKNRVRASVNPTNHVKRGVRQVAFPYDIYITTNFINLSFDTMWEIK